MTESPTTIPRHIAVIMDGNGRWAKKRGLPRIKGHEEGANSVRDLMKSAQKAGVEVITLYAFSSENWSRPEDEVKGLMNLLPRMLVKHENLLHENHTRLRAIGRLEELPDKTYKELSRVMKATDDYTERQVVLALNYGARAELVDATREIAKQVQSGNLDPEQITDETIASHLYAPDLPDPDLMIRTSGENRLSNFLLWQLSYAEFYFAPELWPEFREEAFRKALEIYASRQRRYGGVTAC
jgi:undecaprenyl diphosphate synthase